ncbi:MAG: hypothetical protein M3Z26_17860 [Bacteroidota bacterium]|nr:hypothetical protein [Bacteroidota bacterium]
MKKITAIFFLILFSFNWFGYRLLFDYMQHRTNEKLEAFLDNNSYDDSQLIELKIPVHLPYQNSWTSFERYDGEIELNGTMYKYVKRKLSNDTLYLMCIPNSKKMRLEIAKNDFFKNSNDFAQNDNSKKSNNSKSVFKNLQTVYNESSFGLNIIFQFDFNQNFWLPLKNKNLLSARHISHGQPPDLLEG